MKYVRNFCTCRHKEQPSTSIAAFIIIGPSTFSRTVDASLADIHVIRSREIPDPVFFRLIDLAVELTKQLDVGFMECVYAVSATCYNLINELVGRLQFKAVATLPNCVHMANGIGLCDNIVLIRNIEPLTYNRQVIK